MNKKVLSTNCCIVGGGAAGIMTGFLLARAGVEVIVLEKHKDFFRDFRGDTIHPTTFQVMHELGLLEEFLKVPHQEVTALSAIFNGQPIHLADFSHLKLIKPAVGLMPQWDFLNFLASQAAKYPSFTLIREANVVGLLKQGDTITGVSATTLEGMLEIKAKLVIGTDGRDSTVRKEAELSVIDTGVPIDVLWFRLSRQATDPGQVLGNFYYGQILILLDREEYWQCAYVINKGGFEEVKTDGLDTLKKNITEICPFLSNRVQELKDWSAIQLLSVKVDHLKTWYRKGLICIGDAAHAMSPVGGVGINLALQDAVAAANILWKPLSKADAVPLAVLRQLQKRRAFPARLTQSIQVYIHKGISYRRKNKEKKDVPLFMRLFDKFPLLRRIPALLVGRGVRPEHVKSPEKTDGRFNERENPAL